MSAQNIDTNNVVNPRVRSGGVYWKMMKIGKNLCNRDHHNIWYLVSGFLSNVNGMPTWLISNVNLAYLLNVSPDNLGKYAILPFKDRVVYHDDAPTHFVSESGKPIKRTRQVMWTLSGVAYILNASKLRIEDKIKEEVRIWLATQVATHSPPPVVAKVDVAEVVDVQPTDEKHTSEIKSVSEAKDNIIESVKYITNIIDQLWLERNKRRELEVEIKQLREAMQKISLQNQPPSSKEKEVVTPANSKKSNKESLSQYLSRKCKSHSKSESLTRMGLWNSDQLYCLFSKSWTDQETGDLIQKNKFQAILRRVFHLKTSTHRTPLLKAETIRDGAAVLCQVLCKKKPNPIDAKGNPVELNNPAYLSSSDPYVRFQVRYTSKAVDYLQLNWYKLQPSTKETLIAV